MKNERAAHPTSCRGCRHDVLIVSNFVGEEVQRISGYCNDGNRGRWPDGCGHYAESAHKVRRGQDLIKG